MPDLFDMHLRALRRDRAARTGPALFLFERAFDDCLERLSMMQKRFERALLLGCPDPQWRDRLADFTSAIDVRDPGACFASAAGGSTIVEDEWEPHAANYDLVLAVGTLDAVNDLPRALLAIHHSMKPGGLFLGAMSGGDTLPRLRTAMRAADAVAGIASAHVHPRIEAAALSPLLERIGFVSPVVDVDRVTASYRSFPALVSDLRAMGATNLLIARSKRPLSRGEARAASANFAAAAESDRTLETFEILHFACWKPATTHAAQQQ